jgi:hypothetical protein
VGAAQVEQHAVAAGHGDHLHLGDDRAGGALDEGHFLGLRVMSGISKKYISLPVTLF